jgi:hypothetical protein
MKLVHMCGVARLPDDCDISEFLGYCYIKWDDDEHSFLFHVDHTKEVSNDSEATTQKA